MWPYMRDGLKVDNLVVFYYLGAFKIRLDEKGRIRWDEPYTSGTTALKYNLHA